MHQPYAQARQGSGERRSGLLGGLAAQLLGFVDQRTDPVRLPALAAGGFDARHHFVASGLCRDHGAHRSASGRQLVDRRDIEVGIGGHRERARDGRRGHDQLVRQAPLALALLREPQPLLYAEAVLLIDDHQREVVELQPVLEECVGADHHLRLAGGHECQGAAPGTRRL